MTAQPRITSPFGEFSTAREVVAGIDLTGKTAFVTGGASGIGVETTRALALAGATVVIAVRNLAAGKAVADAINAECGADRVSVEELELGDLASVRALAARWGNRPLNLLIDNAGVMATPEGRTTDGFETQFGVNHLGHFLLTNLLLPALEAGAPARVVVLSSSAHAFSDVVLDDPHFEKSPYHPMKAYGRSKTANALFALEADRRWKDKGIRVFSLMPGVIDTSLGRHMPDGAIEDLKKTIKFKDVEQGASTTVWAATSPLLEGAGGLYLENCEEAPPAGPDLARGRGAQPYLRNEANARELWTLSEKLVGLA